MIHAYSINSLSGCDYAIKKCTCGYESKIKKANIDSNMQLSGQEFCVKCGTPLMYNHVNSLSFAPIIQQKNIAKMITNNKACFFELELYKINFQMKIDFQKKSIKADKRTIKNDKIKIVFDASQKPEDFIKYYNKHNEEITEECFVNSIDTSYAYELKNYKDVTDKFNLLQGFFTMRMNKSKIEKLITLLKSNKDFFIKYEQIIKSNIDPYLIEKHIDLTKTNPISMLGVRPFTFKYIREQKKSISYQTLSTIKAMEEKIGDQTVNYLQTFGKKTEYMNTTYMNSILDLAYEADLSINKLYKYIYKDVPMKQFITSPMEIITLLRDSFEMSKHLGLVFNKNSKTLKRYHDELVEEYKTIENEVIANKFKKQMEKKQYLQYEEKDCKYCIVVPKESQELVKEGKELRHCVGSYIKRVAEGKSTIVFLREKETPDQSYTTIEVNDNNQVIQIRRKHNSALTEKEAINFVKNWAEKKQLYCNVF